MSQQATPAPPTRRISRGRIPDATPSLNMLQRIPPPLNERPLRRMDLPPASTKRPKRTPPTRPHEPSLHGKGLDVLQRMDRLPQTKILPRQNPCRPLPRRDL